MLYGMYDSRGCLEGGVEGPGLGSWVTVTLSLYRYSPFFHGDGMYLVSAIYRQTFSKRYFKYTRCAQLGGGMYRRTRMDALRSCQGLCDERPHPIPFGCRLIFGCYLTFRCYLAPRVVHIHIH